MLRTSGQVIAQTRSQTPAPSSRAASWICVGTRWRPARYRMMTSGQDSQMITTVSAGSAQDVLASQVGPEMPTSPRIRLTSPYDGLNRVDQRTPATAVETTRGRK